MKEKKASITKKAKTSNKKETKAKQSTQLFKSTDEIFREMDEFAAAISKRAFELFDMRGREPGHDLEDWLKAEAELLNKPDIKVTEKGKKVIVEAHVKDFSKDELEVGLEPTRLAICGSRHRTSRKKDGKVTQAQSYDEILSRVVDLPAAVITGKAVAKLEKGILHIEAPKA